MNDTPPVSILFVCLGNICRSPLAEGVFRDVVMKRGLENRIGVDSAGTGAWHVGHAPDPRSISVARQNGIDISGLRARQLVEHDYRRFTHILGMDDANVADIVRAKPRDGQAKLAQFHMFATGTAMEIVDPYYGGTDGFVDAYRAILKACESLADKFE